MRMRVIDDERDGAQLLARRVRRDPARRIRADRHFASPHQHQFVAHLGGWNAQGDAFAAAAEIEPEHESGLVDGTAAMARAQAKAAVKTMDGDNLPLDVMKKRV